MKFVLPQLKIGQKVKATVVEIISEDSLIVSFSGDLIRVVNQSKKLFKNKDTVNLVVESLQPFKFRLDSSSGSAESLNLEA